MVTPQPQPHSPGYNQVLQQYREWQEGLADKKIRNYEQSAVGEEEMFCDFMGLETTKIFIEALLSDKTLSEEDERRLNNSWEEAAKTTEGKPVIVALGYLSEAVYGSSRERQ